MKKRGRGRDNTMSKWKKEVEGEIIQCPNEKKTKKTNNVRQNRQYRKLKIWQNKTH